MYYYLEEDVSLPASSDFSFEWYGSLEETEGSRMCEWSVSFQIDLYSRYKIWNKNNSGYEASLEIGKFQWTF